VVVTAAISVTFVAEDAAAEVVVTGAGSVTFELRVGEDVAAEVIVDNAVATGAASVTFELRVVEEVVVTGSLPSVKVI